MALTIERSESNSKELLDCEYGAGTILIRITSRRIYTQSEGS